MIEDGAYFKGSIEIDKTPEKESGRTLCPVRCACWRGSNQDHLTQRQPTLPNSRSSLALFFFSGGPVNRASVRFFPEFRSWIFL